MLLNAKCPNGKLKTFLNLASDLSLDLFVFESRYSTINLAIRGDLALSEQVTKLE